MDEQRRRELVETAKDLTLEGVHCTLVGWRWDDYACLAPSFGGFWHTDWGTVERVMAGDKNFTAGDVTLSSWAWLGYGEEVPLKLRGWMQ